MKATRRFIVTEERIRAYSRRGNYHSDPEEAARLGLPGLLAQGMQVAGPAVGLLLDAWGEAFLAAGELDLRFLDGVYAGDTVEAAVDVAGDSATFEVRRPGAARPAVAGHALLGTAPAGPAGRP